MSSPISPSPPNSSRSNNSATSILSEHNKNMKNVLVNQKENNVSPGGGDNWAPLWANSLASMIQGDNTDKKRVNGTNNNRMKEKPSIRAIKEKILLNRARNNVTNNNSIPSNNKSKPKRSSSANSPTRFPHATTSDRNTTNTNYRINVNARPRPATQPTHPSSQPHSPLKNHRTVTQNKHPNTNNLTVDVPSNSHSNKIVIMDNDEEGLLDNNRITTAIKQLSSTKRLNLLKMLENVSFGVDFSCDFDSSSVRVKEDVKADGVEDDDNDDDEYSDDGDDFELEESSSSTSDQENGKSDQSKGETNENIPLPSSSSIPVIAKSIPLNKPSSSVTVPLVSPLPLPLEDVGPITFPSNIIPALKRVSTAYTTITNTTNAITTNNTRPFPPTKRTMLTTSGILTALHKDLNVLISVADVDCISGLILASGSGGVGKEGGLVDYREVVLLIRRFLRQREYGGKRERVKEDEKDGVISKGIVSKKAPVPIAVKPNRVSNPTQIPNKVKRTVAPIEKLEGIPKSNMNGNVGNKFRTLLELVGEVSAGLITKKSKTQDQVKSTKLLKIESNVLLKLDKRLLVTITDFRLRLPKDYNLVLTSTQVTQITKQFNTRSDGLLDISEFEAWFWSVGKAVKERKRKGVAIGMFINASSSSGSRGGSRGNGGRVAAVVGEDEEDGYNEFDFEEDENVDEEQEDEDDEEVNNELEEVVEDTEIDCEKALDDKVPEALPITKTPSPKQGQAQTRMTTSESIETFTNIENMILTSDRRNRSSSQDVKASAFLQMSEDVGEIKKAADITATSNRHLPTTVKSAAFGRMSEDLEEIKKGGGSRGRRERNSKLDDVKGVAFMQMDEDIGEIKKAMHSVETRKSRSSVEYSMDEDVNEIRKASDVTSKSNRNSPTTTKAQAFKIMEEDLAEVGKAVSAAGLRGGRKHTVHHSGAGEALSEFERKEKERGEGRDDEEEEDSKDGGKEEDYGEESLDDYENDDDFDDEGDGSRDSSSSSASSSGDDLALP